MGFLALTKGMDGGTYVHMYNHLLNYILRQAIHQGLLTNYMNLRQDNKDLRNDKQW